MTLGHIIASYKIGVVIIITVWTPIKSNNESYCTKEKEDCEVVGDVLKQILIKELSVWPVR